MLPSPIFGSPSLFWSLPIVSLLCLPAAATYTSACALPPALQHLPPITSGKNWASHHHIFPSAGKVPAPSWCTQIHSRISLGTRSTSLRRAKVAEHHNLGPSVLHQWLHAKFNLFSTEISISLPLPWRLLFTAI